MEKLNLMTGPIEHLKEFSVRYTLIATSLGFIIIGAFLIHFLSRYLLNNFLNIKGVRDTKNIRTIKVVILNIEKYLLFSICTIMILNKLGIDTSALLASVGVLGLAISFGAKNLVADCISGFFLIFDGVIAVGDVVKVSSVSGEIERITLRNTFIREYAGKLWAVPNGEMRTIGNFNKEFCRAIVEVPYSYDEDIVKGIESLQEVANQWANEFKDIVIEAPMAQGIMSFEKSFSKLRIVVKVKPQTHWGAQVELKKRVKEYFDLKNISFPVSKFEMIQCKTDTVS